MTPSSSPRLLQCPRYTAGRISASGYRYDSEENVVTIWESGPTPLVQLNKHQGWTKVKTCLRWRQGFKVGERKWKRYVQWWKQVEDIFGRLKVEFLAGGFLVRGFWNVKFHVFTYLCARVTHAIICMKLGQEHLMLRIWEVFQ
ncbi:MAG: hypothetical protein ACE5R6_12445 [Candidatus Heimdallarchaeota archaeon]